MSKKIVIIGGVAGGASAAARLRRNDEEAAITVLERGPYISFANCGLPYHIGNVINERDALLVQTPVGFKNRFNIDVRVNTEATTIDRTKKEVVFKHRLTGETSTVGYDRLILSPGAYPVKPPIPGIESSRIYTLKTIPDMDAINAAIEKGAKSAVVVGGGFIGVEAAENLRHRGLSVTLVEALDQILPPFDPEMTSPLIRELRLNHVSVVLGNPIASFQESGAALVCTLKNGTKIETDFAVLCIGVKPEAGVAKSAGLALGERGGIVVNEHMQTSDPDIYAAGDAVEVRDYVTLSPSLIPLAGPANRQGRVAADAACGDGAVFGAVLGTAIVKVFSLGAGSVGMNEKALKAKKLPYQKIFLHPFDHAGYYPGAAQLSLKLLFHPQTGAIYGAQAVGAEGVARRIDVIAMAMQGKMTVFDLEKAELSYAPPYGSAKDPVNQAGFIAANHIRGTHPLFTFEDLQAFDAKRQFLLDVRTKDEFDLGRIPGAVNIPVDAIRGSLDRIPKDKEIFIYCQVGLRGYIATRILSQKGYACRNFSGGYKTWACYSSKDNEDGCSVPLEKSGCSAAEKGDVKTAAHTIDACGLQCPGPILKLKDALGKAGAGETVKISVTDPGFTKDVETWCLKTGNTLLSLHSAQGVYEAVVQKGVAGNPPVCAHTRGENATIVVFSNDLDRALASFIIANGAAAMGKKVTLFFTFWGLNILRKHGAAKVRKGLVDRMFGFLMPRGTAKLTLSKMHMGGMGSWMMRMVMRKKNVMTLDELIASARENGVNLVACTMSMGIMGITSGELIDGVTEAGVADYLGKADDGAVNLFI